MKILPTSSLEKRNFNDEYNCKRFCHKDFRKGWKVRIEIPEYRQPTRSKFREGIVVNPAVIDEDGTFALELLVTEKFRGKKDRSMLRKYSYYRVRSAELVQLPFL